MNHDVKKIIDEWKKYEHDSSGNIRAETINIYIRKFKQALCLLNQLPFPENDSFDPLIDQMDYKPLNIKERLSFIEGRCGQRLSYIQLRECFRELEKMEARVRVLHRTNPK
ncbi:hypothetical protein EDD68_10396 [Melghiribacillus thermohalophilus]|uniref:YpoC-like domain-containing protein n=1 Tax=Melghiribacillus thermohalophilus TaxID=1324956 RepID=A0A4R3N884_9BACI|nr:hypothetical protein [Melghiribacillus thermohalophilus]TCT25541.1 hypothetical protein EDD68_10396 [Melghiribacillus thermohalophilus]